jgi:hypothetical protein
MIPHFEVPRSNRGTYRVTGEKLVTCTSRHLHNTQQTPETKIQDFKSIAPAFPAIEWLQTFALYCTVTAVYVG